ncbi:hypothetical protein X943_000330 [Babesia divergens]|uniref:Vesicle transport v-SNARE N-terminal domain-containing protein n=1 Tax=Babesia divergens TaxID=32595 RepID=A0AAD9GFE3_BABDI|nr:hypothetical protein X943_000330 [Babesia divergens]
MGDLFEEYHRHITRILDTVAEQLKTCELGTLGTPTSQRLNLEQLNKTLASAEETVRQLELEARASDPLLSATRVDEIRRVRAVIKNASNRSKALQNELERNELFGAGGGNSFAAGGHYGQLQENDKLLQQGSEYLQTSFAMAQETEMIGAGAAEELYGQRNMIYNIQNGIGNMRLSLQDADEYLTKLLKQGRLNRVILRVVIGGIIAAIAIIAISRILRYFL